LDVYDTLFSKDNETVVGKDNETVKKYKALIVEMMIASQWPLMIGFVIAVVLGMRSTYCSPSVIEAQEAYRTFFTDLYESYLD
jgi:hypothetical protein